MLLFSTFFYVTDVTEVSHFSTIYHATLQDTIKNDVSVSLTSSFQDGPVGIFVVS
jgi:hypothetical protein